MFKKLIILALLLLGYSKAVNAQFHIGAILGYSNLNYVHNTVIENFSRFSDGSVSRTESDTANFTYGYGGPLYGITLGYHWGSWRYSIDYLPFSNYTTFDSQIDGHEFPDVKISRTRFIVDYTFAPPGLSSYYLGAGLTWLTTIDNNNDEVLNDGHYGAIAQTGFYWMIGKNWILDGNLKISPWPVTSEKVSIVVNSSANTTSTVTTTDTIKASPVNLELKVAYSF